LSRRQFLALTGLTLSGALGYYFAHRFGFWDGSADWSGKPPELDLQATNFLLFADTHFGIYDSPHQANVMALPVFSTVANRLASSPFDQVLTLGDIVREEKSPKVNDSLFQKYLNLLNQFPLPAISLLGNHDRHGFSDEGLHHLYAKNRLNPFYGVKDFGQFQLVWLDVDVSASYYGTLPDTTRQWLHTVLPLKPSLIVSHQGFIPYSIKSMHYFQKDANTAFANGPEVWQEIKHMPIIGVFSGHTHVPAGRIIDGVPHYTVTAFSERYEGDSTTGTYSILTIFNPGHWRIGTYLGNRLKFEYEWRTQI
jgi:3',5'-cyclic AMP phosphodiesterase CpdA